MVYLSSPVAALVARLRHDTRRPLLRGGDLTATLERLHAERDPLYREVATVTVPTGGREPADVVADVVAAVRPWVGGR